MCKLTTEWILESAQSLACKLTTEWILESAQSFSVCTYIYILVTFYGSGAENYSFLGVRRNSDAQKGAACS